jgi:hypothetical protein
MITEQFPYDNSLFDLVYDRPYTTTHPRMCETPPPLHASRSRLWLGFSTEWLAIQKTSIHPCVLRILLTAVLSLYYFV